MNQNVSSVSISIVTPSIYFQSGVGTFTLKVKDILEEKYKTEHISFYRQMPLLLYPGRKRVRNELKKQIHGREEYQLLDWFNPISWNRALKKIISNSNILYVPWWTIGVSLPILYLLRKAKRNGIKTIVEFHNVFDHDSNFLIRFVTKIITKKVVDSSKEIIIHSNKDKEKLCSINSKAKKAIVIPHFSYDFLLTKSANKEDMRRLFSIEQNRIVLLMFGLVRKYKGLNYAIEATRIIKEKGLNVFLLVVGECWMDKQEILDDVQLNGIQKDFSWIDEFIPEEDISKYFSIADIALYPYTSASQSGSMQIAVAASTPIVATDVGGFSDILINEENAILCKKNDSKDLARGIESLIASDNLRTKIIFNAKEQILSKTKISNIKNSYFKIIDTI